MIGLLDGYCGQFTCGYIDIGGSVRAAASKSSAVREIICCWEIDEQRRVVAWNPNWRKPNVRRMKWWCRQQRVFGLNPNCRILPGIAQIELLSVLSRTYTLPRAAAHFMHGKQMHTTAPNSQSTLRRITLLNYVTHAWRRSTADGRRRAVSLVQVSVPVSSACPFPCSLLLLHLRDPSSANLRPTSSSLQQCKPSNSERSIPISSRMRSLTSSTSSSECHSLPTLLRPGSTLCLDLDDPWTPSSYFLLMSN